jgi:hypothetical protein
MPETTKTGMSDPMGALNGLQSALDAGSVTLYGCELYPELRFLRDEPTGKPRFTYALLDNNTVVAVAVFFLTDPKNGLPCFQLGYAVIEQRRNTGVASELLRQAIEELRHGMCRNSGVREFYLEAIVSTENTASHRIASKLISDSPISGTDGFCSEPILQYFRKIEF